MKKTIAVIFTLFMLLSALPLTVFAVDDGIGTVQEDGSILLTKSEAETYLAKLMEDNVKKTIVLPKTTIKLNACIRLGSNKTLIAKGATIIQQDLKPIAINDNKKMGMKLKLNYKSTKNVTIDGGTWKIKGLDKKTVATSNFRIAHAKDITFKNLKIETNYFSHAIELIACKNVKIDNCKLTAKGKKNTKSIDEVLQIDVSTKATAPSVADYGSKFVKGQICKNITVSNCTVKGGRGICTNKTETENGKYHSKHHTNIKILNNTIYGYTYEALCLHNAAGVTVKGNKIYSKGSRSDYNIGLYLLSCGRFNKLSKYTNVIEKNTIKGGRNGIYISSDYGTKFGKITLKNNKLYAKAGKSAALKYNYCPKIKKSKNKLYKW